MNIKNLILMLSCTVTLHGTQQMPLPYIPTARSMERKIDLPEGFILVQKKNQQELSRRERGWVLDSISKQILKDKNTHHIYTFGVMCFAIGSTYYFLIYNQNSRIMLTIFKVFDKHSAEIHETNFTLYREFIKEKNVKFIKDAYVKTAIMTAHRWKISDKKCFTDDEFFASQVKSEQAKDGGNIEAFGTTGAREEWFYNHIKIVLLAMLPIVLKIIYYEYPPHFSSSTIVYTILKFIVGILFTYIVPSSNNVYILPAQIIVITCIFILTFILLSLYAYQHANEVAGRFTRATRDDIHHHLNT